MDPESVISAAEALQIAGNDRSAVKYTTWHESVQDVDIKSTLIINPDAARSNILGVMLTDHHPTFTDASMFKVKLIVKQGAYKDMVAALDDFRLESGVHAPIGDIQDCKKAFTLIQQETGIQPADFTLVPISGVMGGAMGSQAGWIKKHLAGFFSAIEETNVISHDPETRSNVLEAVFNCGHVNKLELPTNHSLRQR